jgi:hypothetical protein
MNITRRIHLNPQSKGNLGKSFEAEFRVAWLDRLGIPWTGSDLDDRHQTFASRHREVVRSYQYGNEQESKMALLSLFRRVLKDGAPVHVIDTRAQADALILSALDELQVLDVCAADFGEIGHAFRKIFGQPFRTQFGHFSERSDA